MATQSLPTMATQAPPLMAKGEDWDIVRWGSGSWYDDADVNLGMADGTGRFDIAM
jgi:hypothetical protein